MKVVEESRLCGGTDFGVHIQLKQKFLSIKQIYWGTNSVWSEGYFVSTVGINSQMIEKYIESQGKKDSGQIRLGFE